MVPEDRSGGGDRQLPIRVVVFPATGPDRQPDPVVWFAGGPGDSAVDTISRVRPLLAPNTSRDLVFIEQRGTGASAMTCPAFPDLSDPAALRSAVESCVDSLDGDPRFYTTSLFADDVDEVLADLDYSQANLVGISYGADRGTGVPGPAPGPGPNDDAAQRNAPGRPGARALPRERTSSARQRVRRVRAGRRLPAGLPAAPGRLGRAVALGERRTVGRARRPVTGRHRGRLRRELGRVGAARHAVRRHHPHPDPAARPHPRRRRRQGRRHARHRPGVPGHLRHRLGRRADAPLSHPVQRGVGPIRPRPARRHGQLRVRTGPERRRVVAVRLHVHPRSRRHRGGRGAADVRRARPRPQRRGGPAGPAGQHGGRRSGLAEQPRPDRARAGPRHRPRVGGSA